jgi:spermidine synthase
MARKTVSPGDTASGSDAATTSSQLPEVNFSDYGDIRFLHLGTEWVQGSMLIDAPFDIQLEYVQRMMVWLLFVEAQAVPTLHSMQLGLGSGALTKFCYKKLRTKTTAVEINPQVLSACRLWFKLPPEDARLQVLLADAGREIKKDVHLGTVDALQVDLYDHEAAAPVLDSAAFYADCRRLLTDDGVMTVNLFGRDGSFESSMDKISDAFGAEAVWAFRPTREGNTVVAAQRQPSRPARDLLLQRAELVESRWGLPARKWLRLFKPLI